MPELSQEPQKRAYQPVMQMGQSGVPVTVGDLILNISSLTDEAMALRLKSMLSRSGSQDEVVDKIMEIRANIDATMGAMFPVISEKDNEFPETNEPSDSPANPPEVE